MAEESRSATGALAMSYRRDRVALTVAFGQLSWRKPRSVLNAAYRLGTMTLWSMTIGFLVLGAAVTGSTTHKRFIEAATSGKERV